MFAAGNATGTKKKAEAAAALVALDALQTTSASPSDQSQGSSVEIWNTERHSQESPDPNPNSNSNPNPNPERNANQRYGLRHSQESQDFPAEAFAEVSAVASPVPLAVTSPVPPAVTSPVPAAADVAAVIRHTGTAAEYQDYAEHAIAEGMGNMDVLRDYGDLDEYLDDLGVKKRPHRTALRLKLRGLLEASHPET